MARKKSYYGAFFWLSLAAFAAPVFVGFQGFQAASAPFTKPTVAPDASGVDHAVWDYLLKRYGAKDLVDYDGIARDHLFQTYLRQLGAAQPEKLPSDAHRLALLCNAYNAFVIDGVITHEISFGVVPFRVKGKGFFDIEEHIFAGETISLNHIEHEVIRPTYQEPRAHMALVCAALSCPAIRPEAYTGDQLERQLADQARLFANDRTYVRYSKKDGTLHLSAILDWYGDDFEASGGYLEFLAARVEDAELRKALEAAEQGDVEIVFNKYDWRLNARKQGTRTKPSDAGEFGSGSVPNQ